MKNKLLILFLLLFNIMLGQCPSSIQTQGNNNSSSVTLYFYDSNNNVIGSCTCNLAGQSGNLNCSDCSYTIPSTSFSTVHIGNCVYSNTGDLIQVLPIELTYFTCNSLEDNILIEWKTESENNNQEFELLRSLDAVNWVKIYTKTGTGNSATPIKYWYNDYLLPTGIYYYKLIQRDYDGTETVSNITSCNFTLNPNVTIIYYNLIGQEIKLEEVSSGVYIKESRNKDKVKREVIYK